VRRHESIRFSYVVHVSAVSVLANSETRENLEAVAGPCDRIAGACCDSWSATEGERFDGGWSMVDDILALAVYNASTSCSSLALQQSAPIPGVDSANNVNGEGVWLWCGRADCEQMRCNRNS
jgi:hypothetical protein